MYRVVMLIIFVALIFLSGYKSICASSINLLMDTLRRDTLRLDTIAIRGKLIAADS
ncbi:hypothetical protein [Sphingobacterium rhinopitheci]|uniref:hypothetical protein n=1 Tax=Sphingobacterium rhinopitheci TaxID=2781960 RepID=UPI001F5224B2|nr:hypothetical protein [Sphingobacterium rhinopitheci]MCI0922522.1 hypothetical protein [Sphingobacterium rhinopitheci]